jgi:serralysin
MTTTVYNSDNFNLADWDLNLPINSSGGTTGTAATISNLTDYTSPDFYENSDGSMTFNAPVAGATTVSTFGAASGLNELTTAGWTLATGGTMSATLEVNSVPALTAGGEGSVIIGQLMVQNSNEALAQLYYDDGKIYFKNTLYGGQHDTYQLTDASGNTPSIGLNQKFSYVLETQGNTLTVKVTINGDTYTSTSPIDSSWDSLPLYFKAGVFNGDTSTSGTSLPQATGSGQATFYGFDMSHTTGDGLGGAQAPVAPTSTFTGAENQIITGNVLTNDTAPAGLTLSTTPATLTTAHGGTVVESANGTFTYTPAANFSGLDSFAYTLKDGSGLSTTGTVDLTVNGSNVAPVAHADTFAGTQNQVITGNLMTNDTDPNGLVMSVVPTTLTSAEGGTVVENANGTFTYTPATGYMGTDSFNYTLQDTSGLTSTGTASVTLGLPAGYHLVFAPSFSTLSLESSSNPSGTWETTYPYATPGSAAFSGRTLSSNNEGEFYSDPTVGTNPFSVSNGVLTITASAATAAMQATEAAANNGASLPYTSGLLTSYTSFAQTYGLYEITAKIPAGQGLWPALWMLPASGAWPPEIDILESLGNAPNTDYMTLHTGTSNTALGSTTQVPTATTGFNTYAVDWEPNTITFYVDGKQVFQEATPSDMHQPMYMLMNLAVGGTGSWPGAPNSSTVFPAQMQISSVQVYASPNTIADYNTVGVQTTTTPPPSYSPPVAEAGSFTGTENKAITGNLLANNGSGAPSDPNGLTLSVVAATVTTAHGGSVEENANGTFTYTPATGYTGKDSFTYTVEDSAGLTATATESITVNAAALLPPVAGADSFTGTENTVVMGNLITHDTDPNGLALSVVAVTLTTAHGGTVVESTNGAFTYTPATGYTGTDSFNYTLEDSAGLTATGTTSLTLSAPASSAPVFTGTANGQTLNANASIGSTLNGYGTDTLEGHNGNDTLNGGTGNEKLYGYYGNDYIVGGTGNDTLNGGPGNDTLVAGHGSDSMTGGGGADHFVFNAATLNTGTDTITDFSASAGNVIDISNILSGHYTAGTSVLSNFVNIINSGSSSILEVDLTGHAGASGWTHVTTLLNETNLNEQTLLAHGNLIV